MSYHLRENIRFLRRGRGLSQQELANQLELTRSKIASYENGNSEPNLRNLKKIIDFFGVSFETIFSLNLTELGKLPKHKTQEDIALRRQKAELLKEERNSFISIITGMRALFQFRKTSTKEDKSILTEKEAYDLLDITDAVLKLSGEIVEEFE